MSDKPGVSSYLTKLEFFEKEYCENDWVDKEKVDVLYLDFAKAFDKVPY